MGVDGPAFRGGLRHEHSGWRIIKVDDMSVTAATFESIFSATRFPGRTFSMTIQRPKTGDITLSSTNDTSSFAPRVYIDPREFENMEVDFDRLPDGSQGTQ